MLLIEISFSITMSRTRKNFF